MRTKKGIVTSAKMTGTVSVTVHTSVLHPIYKKRYRKSKKFLADSKGFDLAAGDSVLIAECRPLSKNKHFRVQEILKSVPRVSEMKEEAAVEALLNKGKPASEESSDSSDLSSK
jgi:small subunit ribosomal protein S17